MRIGTEISWMNTHTKKWKNIGKLIRAVNHEMIEISTETINKQKNQVESTLISLKAIPMQRQLGLLSCVRFKSSDLGAEPTDF